MVGTSRVVVVWVASITSRTPRGVKDGTKAWVAPRSTLTMLKAVSAMWNMGAACR